MLRPRQKADKGFSADLAETNATMTKTRNSRFGRMSVFTCKVCKRSTRETNPDHGQTGNCAICFELAGIENTISDEGIEQAAEYGYVEEARKLLAKLAGLNGDTSNWDDLVAQLDAFDAAKEAK